MKYIEVVAALIIKNDTVLITQRKGGPFDGLWEFPGGKIEDLESHQEALIREIREELKCIVVPIQHFKTIKYQYPDFHLTMHLYISKLIKGKPTLTEHAQLKWVSHEQLEAVKWLPADIDIIEDLKNYLKSLQ